jgi:hypothetical protein
MGTTFVVKNVGDVDALFHSPLSARTEVRLVPVSGREDQARRLEARLHRTQTSCGCEAGAISLLAAVLLYLLYLVLGVGGFFPLTVSHAVTGVALCLGATVAGKMGGLVWAQISMRRTLNGIRAYYDAHIDSSLQLPSPTTERL